MRFHCGISFSWKTIKKFLFPILIGFLAYFGFNGIYDNSSLSIIQTYAQTNNDTSFDVTIPSYNEILNNIDCGSNGTELDVVKAIIEDFDDSYFQLFVGAPSNTGDIAFYIIRYPTAQFYNLAYFAYNSGTSQNPNNIIYLYAYYSNSSIRQPYYVLTSNSCSNYQTRTGYLNFKYIVDNNLTASYYPSEGDGLITNNYTAPNNLWDTTYQIDSLNNNSSYDSSLWFYYTSHSLYFNQNYSSSSLNKKICITNNNTCYFNSDELPSYVDIAGFDPPADVAPLLDYDDSLKTFYTNLSSNNFSNFKLDIDFDLYSPNTGATYVYNTRFDFSCYGRINNNDNYYSYEKLSCGIENLGDFDSEHVTYSFQNLEFYDSSDNVINDMSSYDKLFVTISFNYIDSNQSTSFYHLKYKANNGVNIYYYKYLNPFYDNFDNLPLQFKMYLSSNTNTMLFSDIYSWYDSSDLISDYSIFWQSYNNSDSSFGDLQGTILPKITRELILTNKIDTSIMIYQNYPNAILPRLNLLLNTDVIISLRDSTSNNFYYVDSTGTIQNNNISVNYETAYTIEYNMYHYEDKVLNYLNDLSSPIYELSVLTQNVYDSSPIEFQTFIFILFILFCILFIFKAIKR